MLDGSITKKLLASIAFHKLLTGIPKPDFDGIAQSSWSIGDLAAWQKKLTLSSGWLRE